MNPDHPKLSKANRSVARFKGEVAHQCDYGDAHVVATTAFVGDQCEPGTECKGPFQSFRRSSVFPSGEPYDLRLPASCGCPRCRRDTLGSVRHPNATFANRAF